MAITVGGTTITFNDATTQSTAAIIASAAEAVAGTNNTNLLTPLRLREGFSASGSAPVFAARAWVNFNGTGAVAIRASGNVNSISDNGTGLYTVNFTTSMPDANFAVVAIGQSDATRNNRSYSGRAKSTTEAEVSAFSISAAAASDVENFGVAIFR